MSRKMLFAVTLLACMPVFAFAQSRSVLQQNVRNVFEQDTRANEPEPLCCGQSEDLTDLESRAEARQQTRTTIETLLLERSKTEHLRPGIHVLYTGPAGQKFKAVVSGEGDVTSWYLTDTRGRTVALVNANGDGDNDDDIDVNACMTKFLHEVETVCNEGWKWGISRFEYGRCMTGAWSRFLMCCRGEVVGSPQIR